MKEDQRKNPASAWKVKGGGITMKKEKKVQLLEQLNAKIEAVDCKLSALITLELGKLSVEEQDSFSNCLKDICK